MSQQNDPQPQGEGPNPWVKQLMIWGGIFLALLLVVTMFSNAGQTTGAAIRYSDFRAAVAEGEVQDVQMSAELITGKLKQDWSIGETTLKVGYSRFWDHSDESEVEIEFDREIRRQWALSLVAGVLLSGAMFGDNLSIISDTTIASTRTQGARMADKFKENIKIALPAALLTLALYIVMAKEGAPIQIGDVNWSGVLPYAAILLLAVAGMNVFLVLLLGIVLAAAQGSIFADYALGNIGKDIATGLANVQEIFILAMLVSSLSEFIKQQGGLTWIAGKIQQAANGLKLAGNKAQQLAIAALAFLSNLCIANNTVAIVLTGEVSKTLAQQHAISPRRSASLLDIFACISQGLVPYGAQALLLGASFGISPWQVVTQSYYCMLLLVVALVIVLLRKQQS